MITDKNLGNYTPLQANVLNSLESEDAKDAFMWGASRKDADRYLYKAEAYAREVDMWAEDGRKVLDMAKRVYDEHLPNSRDVRDELYKFVLKRHANWHFPQTQKCWCD